MNEEVSMRELIRILHEERRLDLRGYKPTTLERRLRKRMFDVGVADYGEYVRRVREDPQEINPLLNTILINVTEFFRDAPAWDYLRAEVLPEMLEGMKAGDTFRAWSAGCASGEEAYSLAILVADYFGPRLPTVDVKIYATDVDEDALNVGRRGEYPLDRLKRTREDWRRKYFQGTNMLRFNRDLRRLVIFGRSNLVTDAPISHCNLVICRNVLIYFDTDTQNRILGRLHYALEPRGVLFLGRAESKLATSRQFNALNLRWRIFQRNDEVAPATKIDQVRAEAPPLAHPKDKSEQELKTLKLYQRYLLETLKPGVLVLDATDVITLANAASLQMFGLPGVQLAGKRLQNTEFVYRCPELASELDASRDSLDLAEFQCRLKIDGEEHTLLVRIRPVVSDDKERTGTIIYSEDISDRDRLQGTVEQLEATGEELQSANEELETTNEELQSTNEELETTNEELQSTNEELETTNEELQSLNEELANMNDELETRTRELNALSSRYAETLHRMPWPVMMVGHDEKVQLWNAAAQKLFGVGENSVTGVDIDQLPMNASVRRAIVRACRGALEQNKTLILPKQAFKSHTTKSTFDVQFTPISGASENTADGILIIFSPLALTEHLPAAKSRAGDHFNSDAERNKARKAIPRTKLKIKTRSKRGTKA
jgi:two-component system, chemotaxis family, CheB/CheR fusion protein